MYTKIEYPRNGFSHHALVAKSKVTTEFAKRDTDLLANYGINEAFISEFEAKIQELETVSTFDIDKETKFLSTRTRNDARNALYEILKSTRKSFSIVFSVSSGEYKQTMDFNISSCKEDEFVRFAEKMLDGLQKYSTQLNIVGIKDELILNIQNQIADFKSIANDNSFIRENTDNNTQLRYELKSAVYSDLSHLCKVGKILWETDSPARYKDYVIKKQRSSVQEAEPDSSPPTEDVYEELEGLQ